MRVCTARIAVVRLIDIVPFKFNSVELIYEEVKPRELAPSQILKSYDLFLRPQ